MTEAITTTPSYRDKRDLALKIIGMPIPVFMALYFVSVLTSMSGMEMFGWATGLFTLLYIVIDKVTGAGHFRPFRLGVEIPLVILLIVAVFGLIINAPDADFISAFGKLRWIVLLYLLAYSFDIFQGLNRMLYIFIGVGTFISSYAIFQHFTCQDLIRGTDRAVHLAPFEGATVCQVAGTFNHHLTYGYSFAMLACIPFAALLLGSRKSPLLRSTLLLASATLVLSLIWTYGRGVWIASALSFLVIAAYVSRRHLMALLVIVAIAGSVLYTSSPGLQERMNSVWSQDYFSNQNRRELWKANWAMFLDHPWIGVGYTVNEDLVGEYYKKVGIESEFGGHAHNNYIQMLSTTGALGFASYMLFILSFLMITNRLWNDIPRTHFWHRVLALGALGAQVVMHSGGLTQWNFGDGEVNHQFILLLAAVAYLTERYSRGIVPDDYAL